MPENPYGLSPQDVQDLRDIATHLPAGDPRMAKVSLLLNSVPTQFEQERDPANQKGFLSSATSEIGNAIKSIPSMLTPHMPSVGIVDAMSKPIQVISENAKRKQEGYSVPYRAIAGAVSTALPVANVNEMEHQADVGNARGVLGTAAGDAAMAAAPEALKAVRAAVPSARGVMAARMAEVPAGEQFSRGEVLDAARQHGVNLDLAQATDSPTANSIKRGNKYSMTAEGTYDTAQKSNLQALEQWAKGESSKYDSSAMSPESAGTAIQSELERQRTAGQQRNNTSLERDASAQLEKFPAPAQSPEIIGKKLQESLVKVLDAKKTAARQMYSDLDARAPSKIDVTGSVQSEAQKIIDGNKDYYSAHPELKPKQAWGILEDLASPAAKGGAKSMSWSELHQLRSDLMDFYRNSPDVVKGRSEAWIQQMVGKIDSAMTDSANGLSGADLAKFRQANATWESIKSTFDNPQHPYYHAVRSGSPTHVLSSMESLPPEFTRDLQGSIDKDTFTSFQRNQLEKLLDPKNSGTVDFAGIEKRVINMGDGKLKALFGEHAPAIKRFSQRATDIASAEPFGDAGSPLNKAADARNSLDVVKILSGGGPELARQVQATVGSLKGQFQRQFVENLINDKNGNLDLGRLQQKLDGIPQDHLEAMVGADGVKQLKLLASTSRKVLADANPSGTAKTGIPRAEMGTLGVAAGTLLMGQPGPAIGVAAELGAQRLIGKAFNSRAVIDYLTKRRKP